MSGSFLLKPFKSQSHEIENTQERETRKKVQESSSHSSLGIGFLQYKKCSDTLSYFIHSHDFFHHYMCGSPNFNPQSSFLRCSFY